MSLQTLSKYENDCLQDYGYLPDLEEVDADLESLAATPEGLGLEKVDAEESIPVKMRVAEAVRQIHLDEVAKIERMRYAA